MVEENKKFKISGIGLDTTTIKFTPVDDTVYDYLYTSISANNDYIISDYVKSMPLASLVVGVDSVDNINDLLYKHIKTIGRDSIDLLLVDAKCNLKDLNIEEVSNVGVKEIGIKNPISVDQILNTQKDLGENKLKTISLNISPFCFNFDIIDYCNNNNIKIMSFNPFGGNISSQSMIESFSSPYLLSFSSTYSTVMFLSGRDLFLSRESKQYVENLIGKDTKPIFVLRKNVNKLIKPIKKVVNTCVNFEDLITINYNSPELLYNYEDVSFSLGKVKSDLITIDDTVTDIEKEVNNLFKISYIPSNIEKGELFALYRYQAFDYLKIKYLQDFGWNTEYLRMSDNMVAIKISKTVKKGWIKKKDKILEEVTYFFAMVNDCTPVFLKLKNSNKTA